MFEVNFFEKKQTNFFPYLIGGLFAVFLLLMGIYFFVSYTSYVEIDKENKVWLQKESEPLKISRQMEKYDQLTKQLTEDKAIFEEKQYPMNQLTKELIEKIPSQNTSLSIFSINETNQVTLVLEKLTMDKISDTINAFTTLPYIKNTYLIHMENQSTATESLVELRLELDEQTLREEMRP